MPLSQALRFRAGPWPFRPGCPGGTAARSMIKEILQPITCFISTKSEILSDHVAPWARAARPGPHTVLTITAHH
jgi:hypothetical protein